MALKKKKKIIQLISLKSIATTTNKQKKSINVFMHLC